MATPGFNATYYLEQKLQSLQNNPSTANDWADKTVDDLSAELEAAGLTAEAHYEQFGFNESQYDANGDPAGLLTPNSFFNAEEYSAAKAQTLIDDGAVIGDVDFGALSLAEASEEFESIWSSVGSGNLYDHYLEYGEAEGINPSNSFDIDAYVAAKAAEADLTVPQLKGTLQDAGLSVLEHYEEYGKDEGFITEAELAVDEADQAGGGETFTLTTSADSVNEGDSVVFTLSTENVEAGSSYSYEISGVSSDDVDGSRTGSVTVDSNGEAKIVVDAVADETTEGDETLTLSVAGETADVTVNDTSTTPVQPESDFSLTAASTSVDEGDSVVFTLTDANEVANGDTFTYEISGVSSDDVDGSRTGSVTVDSNGEAKITVDAVADETTEGAETLTLSVAGETADVTVNDTSTTPPPTDQNFALTTGVDAGADFIGGAGDDTFSALGTTLTTGDDLDGGDGTDELNLTVADNDDPDTTDVDNVTADIANIEQINSRNLDAADEITLNAASWEGVEQLWYDRGTEGVVVENVGALATAGIREGDGANSDYEITYDAEVVSSTSDIQNFVLESADADVVTVNGVETFSVDSSSGENEIDELIGDAVTTYTLQGASDLTIGDTRDGAAQTISASVATGAVTVTIGDVDTGADDGLAYTGGDGADTLDATGGTATTLSNAEDAVSIDTGAGDDVVTVEDLLSDVDADATLSLSGGAGSDALLVTGDDAFDTTDIADDAITSIETVHVDFTDDDDIDTTDVGGLTEVQIEGNSAAGANAVTIADGVNVRILETDDNANGTEVSVDGSDADNTVATQQVFVGTATEAADGGAATDGPLSVGALDIDFTAALTITAESDGEDRTHTVGDITNTNNVLTSLTLAGASAALTIGTFSTSAGEAADSDVFDLTASGDNEVTTGDITLGANTNRLDVTSTGSGDRTIDLADEGDLKATAGDDQAAGEGVVLSGAGTGDVEIISAGVILNELIVDASAYGDSEVALNLDTANAVDAENFDGVDRLILSADNEDDAVTNLADGITIDVQANQTTTASSFELANGGTLNIALDGEQLGNDEGLAAGVDIFNVSELVLSATGVTDEEDADVAGIVSDVNLGDDDYFDKLTLSADSGELEVTSDVIVHRASEITTDSDFAVDFSGDGDITIADLELDTNDGGAGTAQEITDLDINSAAGGDYVISQLDMGGEAGDAVSIDLAGAGDTSISNLDVTADEDITVTSNGGGDTTENEIGVFDNQTGNITLTGSHDLSLGAGAAIDIGDGDSLDASDFTGDLEVVFDSGTGDTVTVTGGSGENTLTGGDEDATIVGGDSDDTIEGNGGSDTITTGGGSDTVVFDARADGVDTYTDFDFGDAVDVFQGTASQDIARIGATADNDVSGNFNGGNVTIEELAADTAAGADTADIFVITDALDQASVALDDTVANVEAAIQTQLADGTDFLDNTAAGDTGAGGVEDEGAFALIQNDGTGGSDGFFLAEVVDADDDSVTDDGEVNLIGIFEGTDAVNAAAADFV